MCDIMNPYHVTTVFFIDRNYQSFHRTATDLQVKCGSTCTVCSINVAREASTTSLMSVHKIDKLYDSVDHLPIHLTHPSLTAADKFNPTYGYLSLDDDIEPCFNNRSAHFAIVDSICRKNTARCRVGA